MEKTAIQTYEPVANALAATALSQTLSFCMERKYLDGIDHNNAECFYLRTKESTDSLDAYWVKINQVGKPVENSAEHCFTAIQKILYSCFMPDEMQLLFLVCGDEKENSLYLGVRETSGGSRISAKKQMGYLNEFMKGVWPGLQTQLVAKGDEKINSLKEKLRKEELEYVYAFTGIPSMESQYKDVYPATTDMLMAGMNRSKQYAYLVVADPLPRNDVESMLYQCREMNGQAESLKSVNVQESLAKGTSQSKTSSYSTTDSVSHTISESVSKRDFTSVGKAALAGTGLGLAATVFPAAGEVLAGVANATGAIATSALQMVGLSAIANTISNLLPTKTKGTSDTTGQSKTTGTSDTLGTQETRTQSVSRNLVNKHIEAVAEQLYYHSKRFETGKAIGMWKVGVYLMANKQSEINGGALQLRSILSGQESIFEPVRIHDIHDLMEENNCREIMAQLNAPYIDIAGRNGLFHHPLGEQYNELKSVITTKELSYLINFPLHSVPGISVIESTPEFSLNNIDAFEEKDAIDFGCLLYGGSPTEMTYRLPSSLLSKHTLLAGINGTGKTNTVQAILNSTSEKFPFLIIEPAKTEYVDWAVEYNKTNPKNPISIFIPGCKSYKDKQTRKEVKLEELRLNPFEVVWLNKEQDVNVLSHIDRLKSTFAAAFPMYDILPVLLENVIYAIYQRKSTNWIGAEPVWHETKFPTLTGMKVAVGEVIRKIGYAPQIESNMMACLNTRIDSLMRGWKGEMLNTLNSTPWEKLFEQPVVINLSYVGDDTDKGFFMALILQFLYEYLTAKADTGRIDFNDNACRHLTVIEEAHRVMMKCDNPEMPQYRTSMMFSNMLSEVRAYGEGMLLVDQVPTRLIPDAIKNTNTKITHRLVAEDDVKAIAESMGLSDEQKKMIPKLLVGQCLVSTSLSTDKHWIKVNKVK